MKSKTDYLLDRLQEECAEIIQVTSKALAFRLDDVWRNSERNPCSLSVLQRLKAEVNDVYAILDLLEKQGVVLPYDQAMVDLKQERVRHYMEYARSKGKVE